MPDTIFCLSPFSNIQKSILMNLKIPGTVFVLIPFFKYYKKNTYKSQNTWHSFFAHPLFQILKQEYLRISKYLAQFFYSSPFSNTLLILLLLIILKETIYIKTIIQTNKPKVKYIITACIPVIITKNFLLLFFSPYI